MDGGDVARAALWAYALPLALMVAGIWIGSAGSEGLQIALGVAGVLLGYGVMRLLEPRHRRYRPACHAPRADEDSGNMR